MMMVMIFLSRIIPGDEGDFFYQCASKGIVKKERPYGPDLTENTQKLWSDINFHTFIESCCNQQTKPQKWDQSSTSAKKGKLMQGKLESTSDCSKGASYAMTLEPGTAAERSQPLS